MVAGTASRERESADDRALASRGTAARKVAPATAGNARIKIDIANAKLLFFTSENQNVGKVRKG